MIKDITQFTPFQFKTDPYSHQREWFTTTCNMEYFAFFWEMGAAKSKVIIDTAAWLFLQQEIDGVVLVSDKGFYRNWDNKEIPIHMPDNIPYKSRVWDASAGVKEKRKVMEIMEATDDQLDILTINVESLAHKSGQEVLDRFIKNHYVLFVIDESTSIKNPRAKRTKAAIRFGQMCDYRRILTGTPITQSPLDLYAQCEFLNPGLLGHRSYVSFKSRYAIEEVQTLGSRSFKKIVGFKNLDELKDLIKGFSSRILKSEVMDLPDKLYQTVEVERTKEQVQAYNNLRQFALHQINGGDVTITSALTLLLRLHQINCGHIKDDDGRVSRIPSNRGRVCIDFVEEYLVEPNKAIIWCNNIEDIKIVGEELSSRGIRHVTYYGEKNSEQRAQALEHFENNPEVKVFVATPATAGKSLTLVQANLVIYYSNGYKLEDRLQSEDRCHRPGQKNNVTYIDLVSPGTVDEKVVKSFKDKKNLADMVIEDLSQMI